MERVVAEAIALFYLIQYDEEAEEKDDDKLTGADWFGFMDPGGRDSL